MQWRWLNLGINGNDTIIYWGSYSPIYSNAAEYTSVYIAPYTYLRGALYAQDGYNKFYNVSRSYPVTTYPECNTGIPSSGTIALSHFYGAFKP